MIKKMHRHLEEYPEELMQREIDLACGLKIKRKVYLPAQFFCCFTLYQNISLAYVFLYIYLPIRA